MTGGAAIDNDNGSPQRLPGDFVTANVGDTEEYENISECIRDPLLRDKTQSERETFDRPKAELKNAFATPDYACQVLSAAYVIARNRAPTGVWRQHASNRWPESNSTKSTGAAASAEGNSGR